jgi:hypothetical protein
MEPEEVGGVPAPDEGGGYIADAGRLGGPALMRGGGGVAVAVGVCSAPAFLLIQRPRSLSKTKDDSSPSLALWTTGC